jgi:predicted transcriptional regulator of viral defense system
VRFRELNVDFCANIRYDISTKGDDAMKNIDSLVSDTGMLTLSDAKRAGIEKDHFYRYVKENELERVAQGIYAAKDSWVDDLYILHQRCPQGVFSHEESLFYHDLTDREPTQHVLTIYTGYNTKRLTESGCRIYTVKRELLEVGKITGTDSYGNEIPVYDLERTICDIIRSRSRIEAQDITQALKSYVKRKDKDLNRLMTYAKLFRVDRIVRNYMEVLL